MAKSLGEQKQALNSKLFAQLTKKQTGKSDAIMDKVLRNMHDDLDSIVAEDRKNGTQTFLKLFNHLMPKEAGVMINNTTNNLKLTGKGGAEALVTLADFMKTRAKQIEALEDRTPVPQIEDAEIVEVKPDLPSGLPIS